MTKTRVRLSPFILEYQQDMAELLEEVCRETSMAPADRQEMQELLGPRNEVLDLCMPGLLAHPRVERIVPDLELKDGHLDGLIQIHTSEYYGVMNVHVTLEDEQGNPIESDYAIDNDIVKNHWAYFASAPVQPGTTIVVRAVALDCLGGVGIHTECVIV